jgi:hypothetical protein
MTKNKDRQKGGLTTLKRYGRDHFKKIRARVKGPTGLTARRLKEAEEKKAAR